MDEDQKSIDELMLRLNRELSVFDRDALRRQLIDHINYLILYDFNKLVGILYRVDVSENKLKLLLQDAPKTDAAVLIADLLISRQEEKKKSREAFKKNDNIPEEDKW